MISNNAVGKIKFQDIDGKVDADGRSAIKLRNLAGSKLPPKKIFIRPNIDTIILPESSSETVEPKPEPQKQPEYRKIVGL